MKCIWKILYILSLLMCLTACGEKNNSTNSGSNNGINISGKSDIQPSYIVEMFFDAFEKGDYEIMKTYCTEECIDTYFHDGDVFGMIWAKVIKIGEEPEILKENECRIFVDVEMETAKTSALYGESETSFYVVLNKMDDGSWVINSFVTG